MWRALVCLMLVFCGSQAVAGPPAGDEPAQVGEVLLLPAHCAGLKTLDGLKLLVQARRWGTAATLDTGLRPMACEADRLVFEFRRAARQPDVANTDFAWDELLGSPWQAPPDFVRRIGYRVATGEPSDAPVAEGTLAVRLFEPWRVCFGGVMVLMTWFFLCLLARSSNLVRDASPRLRMTAGPYSLGRTQMAWWFALIYGAYVFLWLVHGAAPAVGGQALALLTLSGGAGLTAAGLDESKDAPMPHHSSGFFRDLLTDINGITIARFQMLVMTLTQGIFFLWYVYQHLSMPPLDDSALTLMGISTGGYLGFKIPERHVAPEAAPTDAGAVVAETPSAAAVTVTVAAPADGAEMDATATP